MIRVISICVFRNDGRILVCEGFDSVKQERFARPLGGAVQPGERAAQAIVREVREELGKDIIDLHRIGVLENIFEYEGRPGHEVVFVFDGRFADPTVYARPELPVAEPGWSSPAMWRSLDTFRPDCRLVPEGLAALLARDVPDVE